MSKSVLPDIQTTNLTGLTGFTQAERRGVQRLADRLRFELHIRQNEIGTQNELHAKSVTLVTLTEMLQ